MDWLEQIQPYVPYAVAFGSAIAAGTFYGIYKIWKEFYGKNIPEGLIGIPIDDEPVYTDFSDVNDYEQENPLEGVINSYREPVNRPQDIPIQFKQSPVQLYQEGITSIYTALKEMEAGEYNLGPLGTKSAKETHKIWQQTKWGPNCDLDFEPPTNLPSKNELDIEPPDDLIVPPKDQEYKIDLDGYQGFLYPKNHIDDD